MWISYNGIEHQTHATEAEARAACEEATNREKDAKAYGWVRSQMPFWAEIRGELELETEPS